MPRNGSGVYTLPEAPFSPNTVISSADVNSDFSDIATAMTASLARNGEGGMSAALSLSTDGVFYSADPDTGVLRTAANTQAVRVGGEDWTFTTTDLTNPDGVSLLPLLGAITMYMFNTAPTGYVLLYGQQCTSATPLLRAALIAAGSPYGTGGGNPLFPDLRCVVPLGKGNMGGTDRALVTGSTVLAALLGAQSVTLDVTQIPGHTHDGTSNGESVPHTHLANQPSIKTANATGLSPVGGNLWGGSDTPTASGNPSVDHVHGFTSNSTGGGLSHANVQPSIVINFITRAA